MSAAELDVVNSMLRAIPKEGPTDNWPQERRNMEEALAALPPVEGVSRTELKVGTIPAEWSQVPGAPQDRVLL